MKKAIKRLTECGLLLCSVLAFSGCNNNSEDDGGDVKSLSLFRWDFAYINTAKKMGSSLYTKVANKIGCEINAITTGSGDWEDTINRRFKTGELPDMFITKGPETPGLYSDMIKDKAIIPVSDYVSETKYPNIYNHLQRYDFLKENIYYANNKHYCVPIDWSLEFSMYIRLDWIENLNKPAKLTQILTDELGRAPTTNELETMKFVQPDNLVEFYRLARAFRYYDPDENGQNDTWGYTSSDCYTDNWIYNAFGGYNNMIYDSASSKFTNSSVTEGNKKAVAFINRLITEDIMHPDWVTDSVDEKQNKFMQGKVGMMLAHNWYNVIVQGFMAARYGETLESASSKIAMIKPPANQDGTRGVKGHPNFWTAICINADMGKKKIAKALELLDYLHSQEGRDLFLYGIEGEHFDMVDGQRVSKMGQNSKGFNYTLLSYEKSTVLGTYAYWSGDYYSPYATNSDKIVAAMNAAAEYNKTDTVPYIQTPLFTKYQKSLQEYYETSVTNMVRQSKYYDSSFYNLTSKVTWDNLIKVNSSLETDWSSYVTSYLTSYHGQEVINEYNTYATNLGYPGRLQSND